MEPNISYGDDIRVPPPFAVENFKLWKSRMETFLMMDIDHWFALTEGFVVPVDKKGKPLKKSKWTEEQLQKARVNDQVIRLLVSLIPNNILRSLGEYKDACELWSKLDKHHEESSTLSGEDESKKEEGSSIHEPEESEVERCSTSESDSDEGCSISEGEEVTAETSTSGIEGEDKQSSPEQEKSSASRLQGEASTSGREEEEEAHTSSTSSLGNSSNSIKNKIHIICFGCRETGHYKSKCPKQVKKGLVVPKAKSSIRKGKEHIQCFLCSQNGHYRNQCPRRNSRKDKAENSKSGGALKTKPEVYLFNANSTHYHKQHARNKLFNLNANYHDAKPKDKSRKVNSRSTLHSENFRTFKGGPTLSKHRKDDTNLGKNPKKSRHMPKKKKNFPGIYGQSKIEDLHLENQFLRSKLAKLEKTLKKIKNSIDGPKVHNQGLDRGQGYPKDKKGLGHKPKSKNDKPSYHCVPYDYETSPKSRSVKVTREEIPRDNLNKTQMTKASNKPRKVIRNVTREAIPRIDGSESTMAKASKKPRKAIRKVSREVIPSEYLLNPRSSNRFWVPRSVIPSH